MPHGDRTGPLGAGPKTGRAAGLCTKSGMPGYLNRGYGTHFRVTGYSGKPFGRGRGRGWGRGNRLQTHFRGRGAGLDFPNDKPDITSIDENAEVDFAEIEALKVKAENLKSSIDALENQIKDHKTE